MKFSFGRFSIVAIAVLGVVLAAESPSQPEVLPAASPTPEAAASSSPPPAPGPSASSEAGPASPVPVTTATPGPAAPAVPTYRELADDATRTLMQRYFDPQGGWKLCPEPTCPRSNHDQSADSLTYALHFRWRTTRDPNLVSAMSALVAAEPLYPAQCRKPIVGLCSWSDVANWDAVADMREFEATNEDLSALGNAIGAFESVEQSSLFGGGACKGIRYRRPSAYLDPVKTLETEATAVKAALLLYTATGQRRYLDIAAKRYASARTYFLDPYAPLYTEFIFDQGKSCSQLPHRFFASVNGEMIANGTDLYHATGNRNYLDQAIATALAVDWRLSDRNGVFADLLADDDIAEPLVEAMYDLATREGLEFARTWLIRNAAAAVSSREPDGSYPRFFDGPPAPGTVTASQTNGGFSLLFAAAALAPEGRPASTNAWKNAATRRRTIARLPARLGFKGSGIALIGTLGDLCCRPGHVKLLIDGNETFNRIGIWQNNSTALRRFPGSVLFAWRWPRPGVHSLRFEPAANNSEEGFSYLHVTSYVVK